MIGTRIAFVKNVWAADVREYRGRGCQEEKKVAHQKVWLITSEFAASSCPR